ncbi:N-acetylmuramoyl-L-alanine amidase [Paenochrobactrum glaciei]|uniref:N-acetylmuramoyl-L-alanine amidase n=2 Tax=Paenochrobactrum glaciei TaxID=486407 RepID=A0ABN1FFQ8_9HYPH
MILSLGIIFFLSIQAAMAAPVSALTFRMAGDELRTRVVVMFDEKPDVRPILFSKPHRLVMELSETRFGFDEKSLTPRGLVSSVRYGLAGEGRSRLILSLIGPFKLENMNVIKNENAPGYRMMVDIVASSDREFADALAAQNSKSNVSPAQAAKDKKTREQQKAAKKFTIMLDAGHGGIDSGAEGVTGLKEKDVTLAFARDLRDRLEKEKDFQVFMTRDEDVFLRLGERVRLARQHEADLFISIHADSVPQHYIRGATVYTISDKASDSVARAMAERENRSDEFAGIVPEDLPEVTDILLDLTRRETHGFSLKFADKVVKSLEGEISLINNPHRFAGFQVLRAPDVPSVLVEMGYLSNKEDEKLITDPAWRQLFAERLVVAIKHFATLKTSLSPIP